MVSVKREESHDFEQFFTRDNRYVPRNTRCERRTTVFEMSEGILQKGVDVQGLTTAILLPGIGLFADRRGRGLREVGPLTKIGGVSLFQRTVLTLQRAGIRQLIVLTGAEEEVLKQTLLRGSRVSIPVRWMPIREFPLDDPRTWEALAAEVHGFCLIAGAQAVFSKQMIECLRSTVQGGQALVVARKTVGGEQPFGHRNPGLEFRDHPGDCISQ